MNTNNHQEIELKLSCTAATASALRALMTRISHCAPQKLHLQNTYYDTPAQSLRQNGIALRIRRQGKVLLQTVKCNGQVTGGLSSRPEWETLYRGHFDFSGVTDSSIRTQLEKFDRAPGCQATLHTDFKREVWEYRPTPKTHIQIMLDRGKIVAGKKQSPICELELELVRGRPKHLFMLAQQLCTEVALFPAPLSKAARGSLLLEDRAHPYSKKTAPPDPDATLEHAFTVSMQDCLDHISHHLPSNCDQFAAKDLHQIRIGLHHMLALLALFKPWLRTSWYQVHHDAVHQHLHALADARNHYVLLNEICALAPAQHKPLAAQLKKQADSAFKVANSYLLSQVFAGWLLDCCLNLHTVKTVSKHARTLQWSAVTRTLLHKKLKAYAKTLRRAQSDTFDIHQLRNQTKHIRYQYALLSDKPHALLKQLSKFHDALGPLIDLNSAGTILLPMTQNHRRLIPAITALGKWHLSKHPQHLHALAKQQHQLVQTLKHALTK